jgi:hypothetical protein
MIRLMFLSFVLLGAAVAYAESAKPGKTMPISYHGNWVLETQDCGSGPAQRGNMRITGRRIVQFEMVGKVTQVTIIDPQTILVKSRVTHNNSAYDAVDRFDNFEIMSVSPDKQKLTTGEDDVMSVYRRCAK